MEANKLPQNIQALIGDIGEKLALLQLYFLVRGTPWQVYQNLCDPGYDILLSNPVSGESIRIEVKTRQRMQTTSKRPGRIHFTLTKLEHDTCDFLVAYLVDQNSFYIVSKGELREYHSKSDTLWKFILTLTKSGQAHPRFDRYRDAWTSIHSSFAGHGRGIQALM